MSNSRAKAKIIEAVRGYHGAAVIIAAAELDIFSAISKGGETAETISGNLSLDLRAATIILDALAAMRLLKKQGNLYQAPKQVADLLQAQSPSNILPLIRHLGNCLRRWAQLAEVAKTGKPAQSSSVLGEQGDLQSFIGAMDNICEPIADKVIKKLDKLRFDTLLDIGGASGTWTIHFLRHNQSAKAILFDLPDVIEIAREHITQAGLSDRVKLVGGNFYDDNLPEGADLAWLSAITHMNSREQNRNLFKKTFDALKDGGTVVIRDVVMDEDRIHPEAGALFAINMLSATPGGGTYTFSE